MLPEITPSSALGGMSQENVGPDVLSNQFTSDVDGNFRSGHVPLRRKLWKRHW